MESGSPTTMFHTFRAVLLTMAVMAGTASFIFAAPTYEAPRAARPIAIDGDLSEWRGGAAMVLGNLPSQVTHLPYWGGPLDLSAQGWLQWDRDFLYFAAEVTDNNVVMVQYDPFYIWGSDSIQVALDMKLDRAAGGYAEDDREYGWALVSGKPATYCWQGPRAPGAIAEIRSAIVINPNGRGWALEAAIPWEEVGQKPAVGLEFGCSWLVNESDVEERDGWIEWTGGVGAKKSPAKFGRVMLAAYSPESIQAKAKGNTSVHRHLANEDELLLWKGHLAALNRNLPEAKKHYRQLLQEYPINETACKGFLSLLSTSQFESNSTQELLKACIAQLEQSKESYSIGLATGWKVAEVFMNGEIRDEDSLQSILSGFAEVTSGEDSARGLLTGLTDSNKRIETKPMETIAAKFAYELKEKYADKEVGKFASHYYATYLISQGDSLYDRWSYLLSAQTYDDALQERGCTKEMKVTAIYKRGSVTRH